MLSNTHYLLFLSLLIIALNGCEPKPAPCEIDYSFEIPGSFYPEKDTFLVGDTLWLELRIEDFLVDEHSMETFYVGDYDFPLIWSITKVDTSEYNLAYSDFETIIINGEITQNCSFCVYPIFDRFEEDFRLFKMAIIPQRAGVYQTNIHPSRVLSEDVEFYEDNCIENVIPHVTANEGRNADNLYLIKEDYWYWDPESDYVFWGVYPFAVVEP